MAPRRHHPFLWTVRNYCDVCAAEPAPFDHLDLSGAEPVFKRLCQACGDAEKERWEMEKKSQPGLKAA